MTHLPASTFPDPAALERAVALDQLAGSRRVILAMSAELDFLLDEVHGCGVGTQDWSGAAAQAWRDELSRLHDRGRSAGRCLGTLLAAVDEVSAQIEHGSQAS